MKPIICIACFLASLTAFSQIDSAFLVRIKSLDTADVLRLDTTAVPNDALTKKIRTLRNERKTINIETVIRIKIQEEIEKDSAQRSFYNRLLEEMIHGRTAALIDNAMINLYRRKFTGHDIDELIRFYKTPAGRKMDEEFLLLIVESAKVAEQLMKLAGKNLH